MNQLVFLPARKEIPLVISARTVVKCDTVKGIFDAYCADYRLANFAPRWLVNCAYAVRRLVHRKALKAGALPSCGLRRKTAFLLLVVALISALASCAQSSRIKELAEQMEADLTKYAKGEVQRTAEDSVSTAGKPITVVHLKYDTDKPGTELRDEIIALLSQADFSPSINISAPGSFLLEYVAPDGKITIKVMAKTPVDSSHKKTESQSPTKTKDQGEDVKQSSPTTSHIEITISYTKR